MNDDSQWPTAVRLSTPRWLLPGLKLGLLSVLLAACRHGTPDGLVEPNRVAPSVVLDLRYATTNNFTGQVFYPEARAWLRDGTARRLAAVQKELASMGLRLKVFDAYRPLSVQRRFWELVPDDRYVANPAKGSRHNRGAAVDVTLVDRFGRDLAMPTDFDDFSERAHRNFRDLPEDVLANRDLLERVMSRNGFVGLPTEWWHFDDVDYQAYDVLDVPLSGRRSVMHSGGR